MTGPLFFPFVSFDLLIYNSYMDSSRGRARLDIPAIRVTALAGSGFQLAPVLYYHDASVACERHRRPTAGPGDSVHRFRCWYDSDAGVASRRLQAVTV